MHKLKDVHGKERAEYIAILALLPFFLLFQWLGRSLKCLSGRSRQLTASVLCAVLILSIVPITAFADNAKLTVITEFRVGQNKINVENTSNDFWAYGTDDTVTATNVESLPESGWTWAIQSNLSTAEYAIKLNNYNGSYIIESSIQLRSSNKCKLDLELSGNNTVTAPNYGLRLGTCDIYLHGDGNLKMDVTKTSTAFEAHSLVVDLSPNGKMDITSSSTEDFGTEGIGASSDFTLQNGIVSIDTSSSGGMYDYGATGISAASVTVNGGSLTVSSSSSGNGISYGIRGAAKHNDEKNVWEYPANVYFGGGSVEISAGTKATDTLYPPTTAEGFKLWAGSASDKSDRAAYDPAKFDSYLYYTTEHIHCRCGATANHEKSGTCSSYRADTYQPWSDPTSLPHSFTNYYLTTDVVLDETWEMNREMNLCLNGHSITAAGDFDVIALTQTLTLSDCSEPDKQGKITHVKGKTGSGINTGDDSRYMTKLIMYGGNITGNTAENGAGIYCGTRAGVTLNGGSITNNIATENGGGIYCEGDMNLNGGNITGNSAKLGGGLYTAKGSQADSKYDFVRLMGVNISENTATEKGGGIYATYCVALRGYENYIDDPYGIPKCSATVLNNTSGLDGDKKKDNASFATGQYLCIYNTFKGGNVSLNFTGEGTKVAISCPFLTNTLWLNELILGSIHCDDPKYTPVLDRASNSLVLRTSLKSLSASDFEFTPPQGNLVYDGTPKTAAVRAKSGIACGEITVKYYDKNGVQVSTPINAGTYTVLIDVAENDTYAALEDAGSDGWTFTIAQKEVDASQITVTGISGDYIYDGTALEPTPNVTVDNRTLNRGEDYDVIYENNTAIGRATVTITLKGNYSGSCNVEFRISYGHASELMYSMPEANQNGWYRGDVTITAKNGFTIGETPQSFSDTLTLSGETARGGKQVFLKAADGKVYCGVLQYKIDTTVPTDLTMQYNESGFKSLLNKLTFGLFFKDTVKVEAKATDALSGVDEILYYAADSEVAEPESISDWQKSLSVAPGSKKLIYVKVTDKAGNSVIALDQGIIVYSDSAVTPAEAKFDLKAENSADISFTLNLNGNTFREVKNGDTPLVSGADYTVSGNTVTVSKAYFARFATGTIQTLTFVFNPLGEEGEAAATASATIAITDSTHRHNAVKHEAKAATCTADGNREYYTCAGCEGLFLDADCTQITSLAETVLPALRHEGALLTAAKAGDCLNGGNLAYWYCEACGSYFADENGTLNPDKAYADKQSFEKPAPGHDWTAWSVTTPATFTGAGEEARSCTRCQEQETRVLPQLVPAVVKETEGDFKQMEDTALRFSCNMPLDKNAVITVDGKALTTASYRLEGENALTLLGDYLNTLAVGSHTIAIQTADGTAQTTFTAAAAASESETSSGTSSGTASESSGTGANGSTTSDDKSAGASAVSGSSGGKTEPEAFPKTGDSSNPALWIALLFVSGGVLAGITVVQKKKTHSAK